MNKFPVKCSVKDCVHSATFEALLYDLYPDGSEYCEPDYDCRYLCTEHKKENESGAVGIREPRGSVRYPFTNKQFAQGYIIYKVLATSVISGQIDSSFQR